MTLRKVTIDNSVKYFPQKEQTQCISEERASEPNMIKNRKQNKNLSQNNKKFHKNIIAEGFEILN